MSRLEWIERRMAIKACRDAAADPGTDRSVLRALSKSPDKLTRWEVALNPRTPVDILSKLARDPAPVIRWAVACHPSTSLKTLTWLSMDVSETTRNDARTALKARELDAPPLRERLRKIARKAAVILALTAGAAHAQTIDYYGPTGAWDGYLERDPSTGAWERFGPSGGRGDVFIPRRDGSMDVFGPEGGYRGQIVGMQPPPPPAFDR